MISEFCIKMVCAKRKSLRSHLQYRKVLHTKNRYKNDDQTVLEVGSGEPD